MTTFVVKDAFVEILTNKEVRRRAFLARVRDHRHRMARMREIAVKLRLSPHLWPTQDIDGKKCRVLWRNPNWPGQRGTGRTTRMLLSAAVDAMDGKRVVVCGSDKHHAHELGRRLQEWLANLGGDPDLVKAIAATEDVPFRLSGLDRHRTAFYCDHTINPRPDLRPVGREWATNP